MLRFGTVVDISVDTSQPDKAKSYLIQFDASSTKAVPISDMPFITIKPPVAADGDDQDSLLPPFLQVGKKISSDHSGQFYKGYLGRKDGVYRFSFKRHPNVKREEWGVPLSDLPHTWTDMCVDGTLQPGHGAS